jgi:transcriptional regulator with XRE-family HTH domain
MADIYALLQGATSLGERIDRLMKDEKINLSELSRKSGVAKGYLWELLQERGNESRKKPSGETLYALGTALGVSVADLLGKTLPPTDNMDAWPPGLADYVRDHRVPLDEARMLAGIRARGGTPRTSEDWRHVHITIVMYSEKQPESQ